MGLLSIFKRDDPAPVKAKRKYSAAIINRLTSSWASIDHGIDQDLKGDLDKLRGRARDLAANNDYARKFLTLVQQNVVGPNGFTLQARSADGDRQDDLANQAIEQAWLRWGHRGSCEVRGQMSFKDLCRAVIKSVARDGEALLLKVRGADANNPDTYALQLLDVSRLATRMNRERAGSTNAIVMGVEVNQYGRPVAYHLYDKMPQGGFSGTTRSYPASQVLHIYQTDTAEQTRGLPWMHAGMLRLHRLKAYEDAALIAAQVGAANLGFFTTQEGYQKGVLDDGDGSDSFMLGTDGQPLRSIEAGQFGILPEGYDFKQFDPNYPQDQYPSFVQAQLRGFSSGTGVAYHSLANDLEGVNFSSIRSGTLEERDQWMMIQSWFIEAFLRPVYLEWLQSALMRGTILLPNGSPLPAAKLEKFSAHEWIGRRWQWVDPLKDVEALARAIELRIMSPQKAAAQLGMDVEDVLKDIARFHSMADAAGVSVADPSPTDPAIQAQEDERKLELHKIRVEEAKAGVAKIDAERALLSRQEEREHADIALKATQIKREIAQTEAEEAASKVREIELQNQLQDLEDKRFMAELRAECHEEDRKREEERFAAEKAMRDEEFEEAKRKLAEAREHAHQMALEEIAQQKLRTEALAAERDAALAEYQSRVKLTGGDHGRTG